MKIIKLGVFQRGQVGPLDNWFRVNPLSYNLFIFPVVKLQLVKYLAQLILVAFS